MPGMTEHECHWVYKIHKEGTFIVVTSTTGQTCRWVCKIRTCCHVGTSKTKHDELVSYATSKQIIQTKSRMIWDDMWTRGNTGRTYYQHQQTPNQTDPINQLHRAHQNAIFCLRTQHAPLNAHLYRIKKEHTAKCVYCPDSDETVELYNNIRSDYFQLNRIYTTRYMDPLHNCNEQPPTTCQPWTDVTRLSEVWGTKKGKRYCHDKYDRKQMSFSLQDSQERHIYCHDKYDRTQMSLSLQDSQERHICCHDKYDRTQMSFSLQDSQERHIYCHDKYDRTQMSLSLQDSQERHICCHDKYDRTQMSLSLQDSQERHIYCHDKYDRTQMSFSLQDSQKVMFFFTMSSAAGLKWPWVYIIRMKSEKWMKRVFTYSHRVKNSLFSNSSLFRKMDHCPLTRARKIVYMIEPCEHTFGSFYPHVKCRS